MPWLLPLDLTGISLEEKSCDVAINIYCSNDAAAAAADLTSGRVKDYVGSDVGGISCACRGDKM